MEKVNTLMTSVYVCLMVQLEKFKESERGDTNFVSMLLIIGIAVSLAALFMTFGKTVMTDVSKKVTDFISSLSTSHS